MRISFSFDVEDFMTPPEIGLDDLVKMLADVMTAEQVTGTFFLIGEKMRCLRNRGRQDVLESLRRHDVGSHVNMGSIHPTVTERMEHADWCDGVARMLADEVAGVREMTEILGAPVRSLARHGGSYSPQLVAALGKMSLPYINSPSRLPKHNITWYCNNLNFYGCYIPFQEDYFTLESFLKREKQFFALCEERKDDDWIGIFHSHPEKIKMTFFGCQNYYKGIYTPPEQCKIPEVRDDFNMEALRKHWTLHCSRLKADSRFTVKSFSQLAAEFGQQAASADTRELKILAQQAADAKMPFFTDRFTAAEIVDLLARAYLHRTQHGKLPSTLPRRDVMGPSQMPLSTPTARHLTPEALRRVALGVDTAIEFSGAVPSRIRSGEGTLGSMGEVGLGSALVALGRALTADKLDITVETCPVDPYPREGDGIVKEASEFKSWNPHRADLDMADILRHTALQSWTLKPAWPGEPTDDGNQ